MIGATEIIIIVAAAIFLFGGKKVIDWARSIGQAKKAYNEGMEEAKKKKTAKKSKKTKKK